MCHTLTLFHFSSLPFRLMISKAWDPCSQIFRLQELTSWMVRSKRLDSINLTDPLVGYPVWFSFLFSCLPHHLCPCLSSPLIECMQLNFSSDLWFIGLLTYDPEKRLVAEEAADHAFFQVNHFIYQRRDESIQMHELTQRIPQLAPLAKEERYMPTFPTTQ